MQFRRVGVGGWEGEEVQIEEIPVILGEDGDFEFAIAHAPVRSHIPGDIMILVRGYIGIEFPGDGSDKSFGYNDFGEIISAVDKAKHFRIHMRTVGIIDTETNFKMIGVGSLCDGENFGLRHLFGGRGTNRPVSGFVKEEFIVVIIQPDDGSVGEAFKGRG